MESTRDFLRAMSKDTLIEIHYELQKEMTKLTAESDSDAGKFLMLELMDMDHEVKLAYGSKH